MSLCLMCETAIDDTKIPEDLRYSAHFCSKACAFRSPMDRTLDGKHLASPAYIADQDQGPMAELADAPDLGSGA
jgi:hypothetical protein